MFSTASELHAIARLFWTSPVPPAPPVRPPARTRQLPRQVARGGGLTSAQSHSGATTGGSLRSEGPSSPQDRSSQAASRIDVSTAEDGVPMSEALWLVDIGFPQSRLSYCSRHLPGRDGMAPMPAGTPKSGRRPIRCLGEVGRLGLSSLRSAVKAQSTTLYRGGHASGCHSQADSWHRGPNPT